MFIKAKQCMLLFLLLFSFLACSKTETTTLVTTTTEVTTEETTTDSYVLTELRSKLANFDNPYSNANGLELVMDAQVFAYSGGNSLSDISMEQTVNTRMVLDYENIYNYTEVSYLEEEPQIFVIDEHDGEITGYNMSNGFLDSSLMTQTEAYTNNRELIEQVYKEGNTDLLAPDSVSYTKITENYYRAMMSIELLARFNPDLLREVQGMAGQVFDLSKIFIEVIYQFDYQGYDLFVTIDMPAVRIFDQSDFYLSMTLVQKVKILGTVLKENINYAAYKIVGAIDRYSGMYTFEEDFSETLFLNRNSDNYYRYYFEAGTYKLYPAYLFDNGEIELILYNSEYQVVEMEEAPEDLYEILASGYYYINYRSNLEIDYIINPETYKLAEY
ncbi:MAG: hypothetical protein JEZ05_03985 [Tenericutes bacterium]|nr:hypothetical protein [Mycoplasmatota bacterium]